MTKKEYNAKWRAAHPDYFKVYYQTHKGEIKTKRTLKKKRAQAAVRQARWRAKNPSYYATWLAKGDNLDKHREQCRANTKAYYQKHKKAILAKQKAKRLKGSDNG